MVSKITVLQGGETQAKTRLLLALWDLGGTQQEIKKGLLTKRILTKGKKAADYQSLFEEFQKHGVITVSKQGYSLTSPKGLDVLGESLRTGDFQFEGTIVGTWAANALVKWISKSDTKLIGQATPVNIAKSAIVPNRPEIITSYDDFKSTVLEVYDKLNYEYNFNHLVPIYRIRREVGDRLNRTQFNDWLLEMQADDILQLQGGSVEDSAPDKIEDSITTVLDGLRCYAKLLKV